MSVSGVLITVDRSFDPRELDGLELWLAHHTIPNVSGGSSLAAGDNWPGAPDLGILPGSAADGHWSADPATKVYVVNETTATGPIWTSPWRTGARGLAVDDVYLNLVDTGTSTPRTITLTGAFTFLCTIRNTEDNDCRILDDGTSGGTTGLLRISDTSIDATTSTTSPPGSPETVGEFDTALDPTRVYLVMIVRTGANAWRLWVDGVETETSGDTTQDGDIVIKAALETATSSAVWEVSNILLYKDQDWSSRVTDLTAYFSGQFGPAAS